MKKTIRALTIAAFVALALPCAAQLSEPSLTLVDSETFESAAPTGWALPTGWTLATVSDGFAVQVDAAQAGLKSTLQADGIFRNVAVSAQFSVTDVTAAAQLVARYSAAGSYVAQIDAAGAVTLEKRDGAGAVISTLRGIAQPQAEAGAPRTLLLSAIGNRLRVVVDDVEVLSIDDVDALPAGANRIGAVFTSLAGTLQFDNYSAWVPTDEVATAQNTSPAALPTAPVISTNAAGAPLPPLANGAMTNLLQPVLAWAPTGTVAAFSYVIQVSTTTNFAAPVASDIVADPTRYWQVSTPLAVPAVPAGQRYYWRVAARNAAAEQGPYSAAYSFTLDQSAPPPPVLTAPAVNAVVTTLRPAFTWVAAAGATGYRLRIATNFSCATLLSPGSEVLVTAASYTATFDVPQGEYWYCVEARDAAGNWSGFGEKRRFVVNVSLTPANAVNVIAPAPAYTPNVVFTWTRVTGATYTIQIADDPSYSGFVREVSGLTANTYTMTGASMGVYYWRVAVNGAQLPQSLSRYFTITPALPLAPAIQAGAPGALANGAITNDSTPVVDWSVPTNWVTPAPGQSLTYELQLSTTTTFTALVVAPYTGIFDSTFEFPTPLDPGKYYWRVRARTNLGVFSPFSAVYTFTVDTQNPVPPTLTAPALNAIVPGPRPVLTWQANADYKAYEVRIADNDTCDSLGVISAVVATATYTPVVDISQGHHWFCVQARDAAGNWSGFGEIRPFVVNASLAPANAANIIAAPPLYTPNVVFSWTKVLSVPTYRVQVSTTPNFSNIVHQSPILPTATTTYTMTGVGVGRYYWRVAMTGKPVAPDDIARTLIITPALPVAPLIQTTGAIAGAVANAGVTNDTTPVMDWTVPANWVTPPLGMTLTYELQLSTSATFATLVEGAVTGINDTSYEWNPELTPGATYYWRVRAITNLGSAGAFSAAYRFTVDTQAPVTPSLTTPAVNGVATVLRPVFTWARVTDATRYFIQIATNFSCSTVVHEAEVATVTYTPTEDIPQGEYWWCVKARDAAGNWGDFGEKRRFAINISMSPANDANIIAVAPSFTPNVVFTWTRITGATYSLEIATDSSFTDTVVIPGLTVTTYTLTGRPQGTYYWRVAVNGQNLSQSLARRFNITSALPVAPLIQTSGALPGAVANNGVTNDTTPVFDWTVPANWASPPVGASLTYELQLSTSATFATLVAPAITGIPTTNIEWTFGDLPLTPGTRYYWRVRAITNLGLAGAFSAVYNFTLDTVDPGAAQLSLPADLAVLTTGRPAFSWTAATGATKYEFEISDDNTFTGPHVFSTVVAALSYAVPEPFPQGVYYWHVYSLDAAGNETDVPTGTRTLTIDYRTAPVANKVFASGPGGVAVAFTWMAVAGAPVGTTYTIEIDNDFDGIPDSTLTPVTTATKTSPVLPLGDYQYRLVVSNGLGTSGWRTFFIGAPPP